MSLESVLEATGYPARAHPYKGSAASFITYHMVSEEDRLYGDSEPIADERIYSVDFFTQGAWRSAVDAIKSALRAAGYVVQSAGPEIFEPETNLYHIPMLVLEDV